MSFQMFHVDTELVLNMTFAEWTMDILSSYHSILSVNLFIKYLGIIKKDIQLK